MTVATRQTAWAVRPKLRIRRSSPNEDLGPRPLTATLEHPLVLNASLLSKLDMTAFTKEGLMAITRLCSVPLVARGTGNKFKHRVRAIKSMEEDDGSVPKRHLRPKTELKEAKPRKKLPAKGRAGVEAVIRAVGATNLPPEPCRTCGRPEQPERLHSHPAAVSLPVKSAVKPLVRTPITKPVPANFKSAEKLRREQSASVEPKIEKNAPTRPRSGRPRTVTCYVCSREFGTASFPLHEPKCIQKWERENELLPPELRRKLPEKPSVPVGLAEWNEFAWKAAQAALVPCPRCARTFNPDRLPVHLRSCKGSGGLGSTPEKAAPPRPNSSTPSRPPTVPCYICAREFGTRSITIHEPQCLRKWHLENAALPQALQRTEPQKPNMDMARITGCYVCGEQVPVRDRPAHEGACLKSWRQTNSARPEGERLPEPQRPDYRFTESGEVDMTGTWHAIWSNHVDSLIPCRQCGRKFFPDRIERHETACANLPVKAKTTR